MKDSVQLAADDSVLKCLIDLTDTAPKLLRGNLDTILDLMLEVRVNVSKTYDGYKPSWCF